MKDYDLPEYDAGVITSSKSLAKFYDSVWVFMMIQRKSVIGPWANLRLLNTNNIEIEDLPLPLKI